MAEAGVRSLPPHCLYGRSPGPAGLRGQRPRVDNRPSQSFLCLHRLRTSCNQDSSRIESYHDGLETAEGAQRLAVGWRTGLREARGEIVWARW